MTTSTSTSTRSRILLAGLVTGLAMHLAAMIAVFRIPGRPEDATLVSLILASWLTFAAVLGLVLRVRLARPVLTITAVGAVLIVPGVLVEPQTSSDSYRYVWDGRVQLAGISPYRYVPRDPALGGLRDEYLWPGGRTRIGLSSEPTIYPPVAQAWFAGVAAVTPRSAAGWGIRIATALVAVGVTVLIGGLLLAVGRDPRWSAVWAWCPLVLYEAGNNAHVDVVAAALVVLAFGALHRRRHLVAGVALGLAVATKLIPLIVAPVFARERLWRIAGAVVLTLGVVYLPHVLGVGAGVLGYLPGYLEQEGYAGTRRFRLVTELVPDEWTLWVALGLSLLVAVLAAWWTDPRRPWDTATWLTGSALLIASPTYHWYAIILVACVALSRRWEWLVLPVAIYAVYLAPDYYGPSAPLQVRLYTGCLAVVWVVAVLRLVGRLRRSDPDEANDPDQRPWLGHPRPVSGASVPPVRSTAADVVTIDDHVDR